MKGQIILRNNKYEIEFSKGFDLSIPMIFNGSQPNTYGVDKKLPNLTKTINLLEIQEKVVHVILKHILLHLIVMEHTQSV